MIKENIKRIISLVLAIFIIFTSIPWYVFAEDIVAVNSIEDSVTKQEGNSNEGTTKGSLTTNNQNLELKNRQQIAKILK